MSFTSTSRTVNNGVLYHWTKSRVSSTLAIYTFPSPRTSSMSTFSSVADGRFFYVCLHVLGTAGGPGDHVLGRKVYVVVGPAVGGPGNSGPFLNRCQDPTSDVFTSTKTFERTGVPQETNTLFCKLLPHY